MDTSLAFGVLKAHLASRWIRTVTEWSPPVGVSACQPVSLSASSSWWLENAPQRSTKSQSCAHLHGGNHFDGLGLNHPKSGETFVTFVRTQATQAGDISLSLAPSMQNHKARHWSLELPGAKSSLCTETTETLSADGQWCLAQKLLGSFNFSKFEASVIQDDSDSGSQRSYGLSWLSNISSWRHLTSPHLTRRASTRMSWYHQQWKDMNRSKPQKIHSYPVFTCLQLHSYANAHHSRPWHDRNPAELANRVTFAAMSHFIFTSLPNFQPLKHSVLKTWANFEKSTSTRFTVHMIQMIQAIKGLAIL